MIMDGCLFCKIINNEISAEKIYEDENVLAFLDINPINVGHTLVIPKNHSDSLLDTPIEDWLSVSEVAYRLAPKIKDAVDADGINIGMNIGAPAGQVIFHTHLHIMPRFSGDGYKLWKGTPYKDEQEIQTVADRIRSKI